MKTKKRLLTNEMVASRLLYEGKPTTKKALLALGYTEEELIHQISIRGEGYTHLETGLVMQWYDGAWHNISVIVKSNDRFVWLKRWEDLKKDVKPTRILKYKVREKGYSTEYCGYSGEGSKYLGKIIEL